jgi:hypothetical protein
MCPECGKKPAGLQRLAANHDARPHVPVLVYEVLGSSGQPLEGSVRAFMESRFGHNFSRVRVHADMKANESARAVDALAYTVGNNIVFGSGQYDPQTPAGRRLLAHELAHTLQQDRMPAADQLEVAPADDPLEQAADEIAARAITARLGSPSEAGRPQTGTAKRVHRQTVPEPQPVGETMPKAPEAEPLAGGDAGAAPEVCDPNRALTWADFKGTASGTFSAETQFNFNVVKIGGKDQVQAQFSPSKSWVRAQFGDPTNRKATGCEGQVKDCEKFFGTLKKDETGEYTLTPPTGCEASIKPDPSKKATKKEECDTVLGAECDRVAQLESARLLRHEQLHFDIACVLAKKANAALSAGTITDASKAKDAATSKANTAGKNYDDETAHGCKPTEQKTWETNVAGGLTTITIP